MAFKSHIKHVYSHNLNTFKHSPLSEIAGSCGDLGTLLPIFVSLVQTSSIADSSTLVFAGLANIASGLLFGIPIPVQPMKAIAAVAIDQKFSIQQTAVAGVLVSVIVLVLSVSGLLGWMGRVVSVPVVRGIQVGAGLQLVIAAGSSMLHPLHWLGPSWADNHFWAAGAFLCLLFCTLYTRRPIPYALIVTLLGVVLAIVRPHSHVPDISPEIWHPKLYIPSWHDVKVALPAAIGQVPLTTLNSILATSHLSQQLLPEHPTPSLSHLGLSLSITNFVSFMFGAMPICHGSGGLAGQYRFGARSGASVILLGLIKLILGLFFSKSVLWAVQRFPKSLLGIMVIGAGLELAKVAENINTTAIDLKESSALGAKYRTVDEAERQKRFSVMLVTVAGILAFRNDAVGFAAGLLWHIGINTNLVSSGSSRDSDTEREPLL